MHIICNWQRITLRLQPTRWPGQRRRNCRHAQEAEGYVHSARRTKVLNYERRCWNKDRVTMETRKQTGGEAAARVQRRISNDCTPSELCCALGVRWMNNERDAVKWKHVNKGIESSEGNEESTRGKRTSSEGTHSERGRGLSEQVIWDSGKDNHGRQKVDRG